MPTKRVARIIMDRPYRDLTDKERERFETMLVGALCDIKKEKNGAMAYEIDVEVDCAHG